MCKTEKLSYNDLVNRIYEASKKDKLVFLLELEFQWKWAFQTGIII